MGGSGSLRHGRYHLALGRGGTCVSRTYAPGRRYHSPRGAVERRAGPTACGEGRGHTAATLPAPGLEPKRPRPRAGDRSPGLRYSVGGSDGQEAGSGRKHPERRPAGTPITGGTKEKV